MKNPLRKLKNDLFKVSTRQNFYQKMIKYVRAFLLGLPSIKTNNNNYNINNIR